MTLILDVRSDKWKAVIKFVELLYESLKDNLVSIIALPDEVMLYDSNVLVVVERLDRDVSLKIAEAALKVNEQFKSTISYMITTKEDGETIEKFKKFVYVLDDWSDYDEAVNKFKEILTRSLGNNLLEILILPKKQFFYDSNVLVVVERLDRDVSLKIAEAALKVNEQFKSTISYMITTKEDGETIEKFKKFVYVLDDWSDYDEAVNKFKEILTRSLGNNLLEILILPKKQFFYDSNVLVVVERLDRDVSLKIAEAALKV
ncbi:MAG: hypothetical protein ACP5IZ_07690, partial [Thermoprotei archaeon]